MTEELDPLIYTHSGNTEIKLSCKWTLIFFFKYASEGYLSGLWISGIPIKLQLLINHKLTC